MMVEVTIGQTTIHTTLTGIEDLLAEEERDLDGLGQALDALNVSLDVISKSNPPAVPSPRADVVGTSTGKHLGLMR